MHSHSAEADSKIMGRIFLALPKCGCVSIYLKVLTLEMLPYKIWGRLASVLVGSQWLKTEVFERMLQKCILKMQRKGIPHVRFIPGKFFFDASLKCFAIWFGKVFRHLCHLIMDYFQGF